MQFPLTLMDINLLLAVTALILLITSEIISPYYRKTVILIERRRLRAFAIIVGLVFILTIFVRIYQLITLQ